MYVLQNDRETIKTGAQSYRGDAQKIEFLRNPTVGYGWSHEPPSRIATHELTFEVLFGEPEVVLQLDKTAKVPLALESALSSSTKVNEVDVHYPGQGRYRGNPINVPKQGTIFPK